MEQYDYVINSTKSDIIDSYYLMQSSKSKISWQNMNARVYITRSTVLQVQTNWMKRYDHAISLSASDIIDSYYSVLGQTLKAKQWR